MNSDQHGTRKKTSIDSDVEGNAPEAPALHKELQAIRVLMGRSSLLQEGHTSWLSNASVSSESMCTSNRLRFTPKERKVLKA